MAQVARKDISDAKFKYEPLTRIREIRLLELHPAGSLDDDIQVTISHALLDDDLTYEALSYCWGDPHQTSKALCNDSKASLSITLNLDRALRFLRSPHVLRTLWIDAICINQEDLKERGNQVLLMRDVYSLAETVVAWIGEEDEADRAAMDMDREDVGFSAGSTEKSASLRPFGVIRIFMRALISTAEMVKRPWFGRAWVIQEVAVSSKMVIQCRSKILGWKSFSTVVSMLLTVEDGNKRKIFGDDPSLQRVIFVETIKRMNEVVRRGQRESNVAVEMQVLSEPASISKIGELNFLVTGARSHGASDPRDHIYALLGLASESDRHILSADYSRPWQAVYCDYTRLWIQRVDNLNILGEVDQSDNDELKSWVPNFSRKSTLTPLSARERPLYTATGDSRPLLTDSADTDVLTLSGLFVDQIKSLATGLEAGGELKAAELPTSFAARSLDKLHLSERVSSRLHKVVQEKFPSLEVKFKEIRQDLDLLEADPEADLYLKHLPGAGEKFIMRFIDILSKTVTEDSIDKKMTLRQMVDMFTAWYGESREGRHNFFFGQIHPTVTDDIIMTPKLEERWRELAKTTDPYPSGEDVRDAYWRTLVGNKRTNTLGGVDCPPDAWREAFVIWQESLERQQGLIPRLAKGKATGIREQIFPQGYKLFGKAHPPPSVPDDLVRYFRDVQHQDTRKTKESLDIPLARALLASGLRAKKVVIKDKEDQDEERLAIVDKEQGTMSKEDLEQIVFQKPPNEEENDKPVTKDMVAKAFWYDMLRAGKNRQFCVTKKGYMGWAPPAAAVGDRICVLFGGQVPYVVRRQKEGYKFLGESYIHGMMNGEVLNMPGIKIEKISLI